MASGADKRATFAIALQDETSGPAKDAAAALDSLKKKLEEDQRALREMHQAMRALKGGTTMNVQAFRELRDRIEAQKSSIANAQARYIELGGAFGKTRAGASSAAAGLAELGGSTGALPGPLGALAARLGALRGVLAGGAIAAAIAGIVAGLGLLVGALGAATAALLRYGLAQSDARRSELLHLEGLTTIRRWHGLAAGSAGELRASIDRVSDSAAIGRGRIAGYAEQLYRMGLRGADLEHALEGVSIVASVQGEQWARRFAGMAAGAVRTGRSVQRLADDVRARLGGIASRQALSFGRQIERLRENLTRLFGDLKIEKLLQALSSIVSLFSQTTASGRALKAMFEALFQPLVDMITDGAPIARRFFQGLVIGALLFTIALQKLRNWLVKTFGGSDILQGINLQKAAVFAGIAVVGGLTLAVLAAAAAFGVLAVSAAVIAAPFVLAYTAAIGLGAAIAAAVAWFRRTDWAALGRTLVDGLVAGLRAGVTRVRDAVRGLARTAKDALKDALGIRSPSRVFAELGLQIPRGLESGVESGIPAIERSVAAMVEVPEGGPAAAVPTRAAAGPSVSIAELHIHAESSDPERLAESFRDALANLLEGAAIEMGAA